MRFVFFRGFTADRFLYFLPVGLITMELPSTLRSAVSDDRPTNSRIDLGRIIPFEFPILTIDIFIALPAKSPLKD